METSTIIASVSAIFALISVVISWRSYSINTNDRRLKDNPFFIIETKTYTSQLPNNKTINKIAYNFIKASNDKDRLDEIKAASFKDYKNSVYIKATDQTYMKLYNAGGIGKNLKIESHVVVPQYQLEEKTYYINDWEVEVEKESDDRFGEYSIFTSHENTEDMIRTYYYSDLIVLNNTKGINAGGYLKVLIPNEFIIFTNLYIAGLVDRPPYIKFNIEGENTYNTRFSDELTLTIERYKTIDSNSGHTMSIDISGI